MQNVACDLVTSSVKHAQSVTVDEEIMQAHSLN